MQYAFYFGQSRCMGCNTCTVACKDFYQVNPGPVRWRRHETYETETGAGFFNLVMSCNHCENPACVPACSVNAISKRSDGIVIVDRSKCQKLKSCVEACPFSAPHIAGDKQEPEMKAGWLVGHPMQKCNFCIERLRKGEKPVCVASCPAHALDYGDIHELRKLYPAAERMNISDFPYAYKKGGKTDTNPSLLIKKRRPLDISEFI